MILIGWVLVSKWFCLFFKMAFCLTIALVIIGLIGLSQQGYHQPGTGNICFANLRSLLFSISCFFWTPFDHSYHDDSSQKQLKPVLAKTSQLAAWVCFPMHFLIFRMQNQSAFSYRLIYLWTVCFQQINFRLKEQPKITMDFVLTVNLHLKFFPISCFSFTLHLFFLSCSVEIYKFKKTISERNAKSAVFFIRTKPNRFCGGFNSSGYLFGRSESFTCFWSSMVQVRPFFKFKTNVYQKFYELETVAATFSFRFSAI